MRTRSIPLPSLAALAAIAPVALAGPLFSQEEAAGAGEAPPGQEEQREERVRQHVERGDELREAGDLEGALTQYAAALQIDPQDPDAQEGMREAREALGEDPDTGRFLEDAVQRERVRRAQARLQAGDLVQRGDELLRAERYEEAVESYRRALNIVRFGPLVEDDELNELAVRSKLDAAMELAQEAREQEADRLRLETRLERERVEAERAQYRANKLRAIYTDANEAFQREDYALAEALAEQILVYDPGNEYAIELRDIAASARHHRTNAVIAREYRENWIRTFDELRMMGVPQTETLEFDLRRWADVRTRQPFEFAPETPERTAQKEAVLGRLAEVRVPARFGSDGEGAPIEEVAAYLQSVSNVNFVISPAVRDLDEEETSILLDLPERSVLSILNVIDEINENIRWKVEDGVVKFVTPEELVGGQVLRMYEVRDLIRPVTDFPGREINIIPSGGLPELDEDIEERDALIITDGALEALIQDHVAPESWDADPANSLRISNGTLVVNQTPEVQEMIQDLLNDLREATGIMVDIQARFLRVEDNFLEDIGVDFRGLGSPGAGTNAFFDDFGDPTAQAAIGDEIGTGVEPGAFFDDGEDGDVLARTENLFDQFLGDEDVLTGSGGLQFQWTYLSDLQVEMILTAVAKSERVELVTAPRVLVFNTARSNLAVMNQVAYVQDFDVEIAQSASIADPVISVVQDGVILDVRPVVSADRRFITLELRPTVAELRRPIANFVTSLGVSGNSVTIQLPELEISRVRTSIPMPDGGTVLLGGLKVHETEELSSGVPILNKIPIFSFFFQRQGTFVTNRKLLILLKARIVIPAEHEPTPAQLGLDATLRLEPR